MAGERDDPVGIPGSTRLYRRINPDWIVYDSNSGERRPTSQNFQDSKDGSPMSAFAENVMIAQGESPADLLRGIWKEWFLVAIPAAWMRECGQGRLVSKVYVMEGDDSGTKPLERIACVDEGKELQLLLERNLDLLPGDQIDPGNSLRWLPIREMPVVGPSSGEVLWSIDFLLVDQDSVPTLVECKRRNDARRPRETVGQMLEYAANGQHYWTASELHNRAFENRRCV